MKNHKLLLLILVLLLGGSRLCMAQQEDTLRLKPPTLKPDLTPPSQLKQQNQSLMPDMLGLDGLEYKSSAPKDADTLIPDLTVKNFIEIYYEDFWDWEKKTYGVNFDAQDFVTKNGRYIRRHAFVPLKRDAASQAPYPLHPNFEYHGVGIPISWKPSKHDIWYKKNFGWDKRAIQQFGSQVDSFDNRSIHEVKMLLLVDSIIEQNKADSAGRFSPTNVSHKKRIKKIRKEIRENAKHDLK